MKLKRFNESIDEDDDNTYLDILYDKIKNDNKTINGFEFFVDDMSGCFTWSTDKFVVYATPYYDDEPQTLPIEVINFDGDDIYKKQVTLKILNSQKTIDDIIKYYYEIIDSLTLDLNKIGKLIDIAPILLNKSGNITVENLTISSIEQLIKLPMNKSLEMYNYIIEKYPELFITSKYNV